MQVTTWVDLLEGVLKVADSQVTTEWQRVNFEQRTYQDHVEYLSRESSELKFALIVEASLWFDDL